MIFFRFLNVFNGQYTHFIVSSAAVGLSFLQFTNMNSMRNLFIVGVSLFLGLSIPEYFSRYTTSSQQGPAHTKAGWVRTYILSNISISIWNEQHTKMNLYLVHCGNTMLIDCKKKCDIA